MFTLHGPVLASDGSILSGEAGVGGHPHQATARVLLQRARSPRGQLVIAELSVRLRGGGVRQAGGHREQEVVGEGFFRLGILEIRKTSAELEYTNVWIINH